MGQQQSIYQSVPQPDPNIPLDLIVETSESEEDIYNADAESEDEFKENLLKNGNIMIGETETKERLWKLTLQILFPFLVAGLGMVSAGILLDVVQHWPVFVTVNEIFILVPALLGLKGNLEMTLASRLSTAANMNKMDTKSDAISLIVGNLSLVQCQGIVIGFLAAFTGVIMGWATTGNINGDHVLLLASSSVCTASIASFVLGLVMVLVIILSRKCNVNPDNVATPIAASLGDLTTLGLLSWTSSVLWEDQQNDRWLIPVMIVFYIIMIPVSAAFAYRCQETRAILFSGWSPVLIAMLISSGGGLILDIAVDKFKGIAVFQPVMNGVGGNLVAVQASRMSTYLHLKSEGRGPGHISSVKEAICVPPWNIVYSKEEHTRTSLVLLLLVVPGHCAFVYTISFLEAGHTTPTAIFLVMYLFAALCQVAVLLYVCRIMVYKMWALGIDPDNSAIPYLTALGDLLGGAFLGAAFWILESLHLHEFTETNTWPNNSLMISSNISTTTLASN